MSLKLLLLRDQPIARHQKPAAYKIIKNKIYTSYDRPAKAFLFH